MHKLFSRIAALVATGLVFAGTAQAVNQAPAVSLTSPTAGSVYNAPATITLAANASDPDGTIDHVEFYQGTTLIASVKPGPYTFQWTGVAAGNYSLTAKAFDNLNKATTSAAVTVSVVAVTTFITSPADGATVPSTDILVSGTFVGPATTTVIVTAGAGHSVVADVSGASFSADGFLSPGLNTIEVQVARRDGTSQVVTSHVTYAPQPVVAFTAPAFCGPYMVPTPITFTVDAASLTSTITKVDFFDGNTLLGTATSPPYTISPTYTAFGSRVITATATDANGFTGSATMVITSQTQPPQVQVTSPIDGSTYSTGAPVPLAATATDPDGTISSFSILVDGGLAIGGSPPLSTNYTFSSPGSYVVTARATDNSDMTVTSAPVTVNIIVNTPPTVSLTSPAPGASYAAPASVTLQATASDSDGTIKQVQFQRDGGIVVATVTQPPYTATATNLTAGSHSFTAIATDNSNAQTTSGAVSVNVVNDVLPTVSITSPAQNSSFVPPANLAITAAASDSDGSIAKVDFLGDGNLLGTATAPPYTVTWLNVPFGTHSLTARATDNVGGAAVSAPVTITIAGTSASISAPADGARYDAPAAYDISATAVTSSGTLTRAEWYDGATLIGFTTFNIANVSVTFPYSGVGAGTHVHTVKFFQSNGSTITTAPVTVTVNAVPTVTITAPLPGTFFLTPATVPLAVSVRDFSSAVQRVEYLQGTTSIGTATVAPFDFSWSNVAAGSYSVTAKATDANGVIATSPVSTVNVAATPTISVDSGIEGSTTAGDTALISGTVQSHPNSGVTINGRAAVLTAAGRFFFNDVPLVDGANSFQVVVTGQDGQTASQTVGITRSGAEPFHITVGPAEGLAPLATSFQVTQVGTAIFGSYEIDFDGDGIADYTSTTLGTASFSMPAFHWRGMVTVKDLQGAPIQMHRFELDSFTADARVNIAKGLFRDMVSRLGAGSTDGAANLVTSYVRERYRGVFTAIHDDLLVNASGLGQVASVQVGTASIHIVVVQGDGAAQEAFIVQVVRDVDGVWRLEAM